MAYQLKNRALPADFDDASYAPCIFCGEMIYHFNGGGTGMTVNSCESGMVPPDSVWRIRRI